MRVTNITSVCRRACNSTSAADSCQRAARITTFVAVLIRDVPPLHARAASAVRALRTPSRAAGISRHMSCARLPQRLQRARRRCTTASAPPSDGSLRQRVTHAPRCPTSACTALHPILSVAASIARQRGRERAQASFAQSQIRAHGRWRRICEHHACRRAQPGRMHAAASRGAVVPCAALP